MAHRARLYLSTYPRTCALGASFPRPSAGSDGLWDNVYSSEVLELVPSRPQDIDSAADRIAKLARRHAADPNFASPYTAEARAQG